MASLQAQKRLTREYKTIQQNPPPFITARPNEHNILEWHYIITGPPGTEYEGGQYHGTLTFQKDYPFKPPAIRMVTPSGRFKTNTRLCLSMSDYHPDSWNPAWSVSTILTGLLSFMTSNESTTGSLETTAEVKRRLAKNSKQWNISEDVKFVAVFPELIAENQKDIKEAKKAEEEKLKKKQLMQSRLNSEKPIDIDQISDPEDRLRAIALNEASAQRNAATASGKSNWWYSVFIVVLLAVGTKLLRN